MQNIFGPMAQSPNGVTGPAASPVAPQAPDVNARMNELYNPSHTASDAFNDLASQYPERQNPSALRKIGAAITGIGYGPQAAMNLLEQPHTRDVEDWKNRMGPLQQSANLERQENVNSRTLAYQTIAAQLRQEALDNKEKLDDANLKIRQQRADVYDFKARNPDLDFDFSGDTIKVVNPKNGEIKDTGVKTGNLSDADKLALQHKNRLSEINATGSETRKTEDLRQSGRESLATQNGWTTANIPDPTDPTRLIGVRINNDTGEVKRIVLDSKPVGPVTKTSGTGSTAKPELPTQTRVRMISKAREIANKNPDWAKYIKIQGNDFIITKPGGWGGPDKATFDKINNAIYGSNTSEQSIEKEIPNSGGKMAISTDGGKTWKAK